VPNSRRKSAVLENHVSQYLQRTNNLDLKDQEVFVVLPMRADRKTADFSPARALLLEPISEL